MRNSLGMEEKEFADFCNAAAKIANGFTLSLDKGTKFDHVFVAIGLMVSSQCAMNDIPLERAAMLTGLGIDIGMANLDKAKATTPATGAMNA